MRAWAGARFENGVSRTPTRDPTYIVRMTGNDPGVTACLLACDTCMPRPTATASCGLGARVMILYVSADGWVGWRAADKVVLSIFLQWDKDPSDIGKDRIDAW